MSKKHSQVPKKAIIYCRVSSDKQVREGNGLESQAQSCRNYAQRNNLEVIRSFKDEGISGAIADRLGINALIQFLERQQKKYIVIIDDISRLSRDTVIYLELNEKIKNAGGEIRYVRQNFDNTPSGKFTQTVMAASSQLERDQNTERVNSRMRARMEMGYWVFPKPPGYKFEKDLANGGKILVKDEPNASILKEALEGFASNRFQTQVDVQKFLNFKKFSPKGTPFKTVHRQQIKSWLENPLYAGLIEYPKWRIKRMKGQHEGLISEETHDLIKLKLRGKAQKPFVKEIAKDFPLRGWSLCPRCHKPYTGSWTKGRSQKYPYYRCDNKLCDLSPKSIPRDDLELRFTTELKAATPSQPLLDLTQAMVKDLYKKKIQERSGQIQEMEKNNRAIQNEIDTILDKIINTQSTTVQKKLEARIEELEQKRRDNSAEIAQMENTHIDFGTAFQKVIEVVSNPYKQWINGDLKQRRAICRLVFGQPVVMHPNMPLGTAHLSSTFRLLQDKNGGKSKMVGHPGLEPGTIRL